MYRKEEKKRENMFQSVSRRGGWIRSVEVEGEKEMFLITEAFLPTATAQQCC